MFLPIASALKGQLNKGYFTCQMRLLIETELSGVVEIDVGDLDYSVMELKDKLEVFGLQDVIFQTVFFGGFPLEDTAFLQDFGIEDGDVLKLGVVPLLQHDVVVCRQDTADDPIEPCTPSPVPSDPIVCTPLASCVLGPFGKRSCRRKRQQVCVAASSRKKTASRFRKYKKVCG